MSVGPTCERCGKLLEGLRAMLRRHDEAVDHERYRRDALYEGRARPKNDGRLYVFMIGGPKGQGFYPCWCNPVRDLLNQP